MYTVGRLAKRHGLSRSTLLYYDRIGLLRPRGHAKGEYRAYSDKDDARLARICEYRRAGIGLEAIRRMLDDPAGGTVAEALRGRLVELNREMDALRGQQSLVAVLLGRSDLLDRPGGMDKAAWVGLLAEAGFSEADMRDWHVRFERSAPDRHEAFLRRLRIPDAEISAIRAMAAAPHEILNINRQSGRFMEIFFKIYEGLKREGPGSLRSVERALALCAGLAERPDILEPGCGSGGATLNLVRLTLGTITCVDVYQPFLDELEARVRKIGATDRVRALKMDMAALDFAPESFDLIWCEGAAYIMGVDNALAAWRPLLRPGGCLVFSDAVWATDDVPGELRAFWRDAYPAMRTAADNVAAAEEAGYASLGHFLIEPECWAEFYADVEARLAAVEPEYGRDPDGRSIIDATRREIALYRRHPGRYGYAVHVLRRC